MHGDSGTFISPQFNDEIIDRQERDLTSSKVTVLGDKALPEFPAIQRNDDTVGGCQLSFQPTIVDLRDMFRPGVRRGKNSDRIDSPTFLCVGLGPEDANTIREADGRS